MENKFVSSIKTVFDNGDKSSSYYWCDLVYSDYILNGIFSDHELVSSRGVIERALEDDGRFHDPNDSKSHNDYHSVSYHLTALKILDAKSGDDTKCPALFIEDSFQKSIGLKESLNRYEKINLWRGSHKIGGAIASGILLHEQGALSGSVYASYEARWLAEWSQNISRDGLWYCCSFVEDKLFSLIYKHKHDPLYAKYGAAAHMYWIFEYLGKQEMILEKVDVQLAIKKLLIIYKEKNILEGVPYCLDYDLLFILKFLSAKDNLYSEELIRVFSGVYTAIVDFVEGRSSELWTHAVPGLLAALAVCKSYLTIHEQQVAQEIELQEPIKISPWL